MLKCSTVHPDCSFKAPTGKNWKIHATRAHGGWSEQEYLLVTGAASKPAGTEFSEAPPETEKAEPKAAQPEINPQTLRFQEMKAQFAEALALIAWAPLENYFKAGKLSVDDKNVLREGFTAALDLYNIQTDFRPVEKRLSSPLWALLLPLGSLFTVLAKKVNITDAFSKIVSDTKDKPHRGPDSAKGTRENNPRREPAQAASEGDGFRLPI